MKQENRKWLSLVCLCGCLSFITPAAHATGPSLSDPAATYLPTCNTLIHLVMDGTASRQQTVDGFTCIGQIQGVIHGVTSGAVSVANDVAGRDMKNWLLRNVRMCRFDYSPTPKTLLNDAIRTFGRWSGNPSAGYVLGARAYELMKGCGGV
jgi:hypothetical protein